jgi:5-methylcytosine-specific restriction endonuclease McrA
MMRKSIKTKNTASKLQPRGGVKAPRKAKSTLLWESEFLPVLKSMHGNHAQRIFHRVMKKSSTLRSTLKRRSKEYEVVFKISLPEIRRLLLRAYGNKCKYCRNVLDVRNMVCDHMVPLSNGGDSTPKNLEMICKRCNTRKGPLTTKEYQGVVLWLSTQEEWVRGYINRKLAGKDMF